MRQRIAIWQQRIHRPTSIDERRAARRDNNGTVRCARCTADKHRHLQQDNRQELKDKDVPHQETAYTPQHSGTYTLRRRPHNGRCRYRRLSDKQRNQGHYKPRSRQDQTPAQHDAERVQRHLQRPTFNTDEPYEAEQAHTGFEPVSVE